jgi:hypothetical protein
LTEPELSAFIATLRPGPPEQDGQDALKIAFTSYFAAARAQNDRDRAQYILDGNLRIGLHEQTRLQSYIADALDAPFDVRSYDRLLAAQPDWLERFTRPLFDTFLHGLRALLEDRWERLATRYMMTLTLPGGNLLHLGEDIPVGKQPFPAVLDPLEYQELKRLVASYDPNLETLKGSGARNWTELNNRMAFIADLFRSRQQDASLSDQPFTDAQLATLVTGKVPVGPL